MARDDRERNFEDALARSIRATLSAPPAAKPAPARTPQHACPDCEILAAYHERLLNPEEMTFRKQHLASCPRCREILVQLEATDEIPLELGRQPFAPNSSVTVPQMQVLHAARASASPAAKAAPVFSAVEMPRRWAQGRWLVPIGAIAAVLVVWVAIRENRTGNAPLEIANNRSQPVSGVLPPSPPPPAKQKSAANDLRRSALSKNGALAKTDALMRGDRGQKAPAGSSAGKPAAPGGEQPSADAVTSPKRARNESRPETQGPLEYQQRAREGTSRSPAPAGTPAPGFPNSAPSAPPPSQAAKNQAVDGETSAPRELRSTQATFAEALALRERAGPKTNRQAVLVSSPHRAVVWSLGPSGTIQRSSDAGANWTPQKSEVVADLLAGSAPSDRVCWIVGRGGTILLTVDGGQNWVKLSSPTTSDITAVLASDSTAATITTAAQQSFETTNGGSSWMPQPNR